MAPFRNIINNLFNKHLFVTNVASSSLLMAVGDAIEQKLDFADKGENHEWCRTSKYYYSEFLPFDVILQSCTFIAGNMLGVGLLLGPLQHVFYKCIDERYPSRNMKSIFTKVALDQIIASPLYIVAFFIFCGALEQKVKESGEEIKNKFFHIYVVRIN